MTMANAKRSTIFKEGKYSILWLLVWAMMPLLATAANSGAWTWSTELVDKSGNFMSLKMDGQGNLHLSYANEEGVKYGFRPKGTSKWYTMLIDPENPSAVSFTDLGLDSQDAPHICYTRREMEYASWRGLKWHIEQIDPNSGLISYTCNLAIAPDGTPHVTWYHERSPDGSNYLHFKYAVLRDGVWLARTIDFNAATGKWHSLAIDPQGNPHISYDAYDSRQLKYAYSNGKGWVVLPVDGPTASDQEYRGMGCSLVFDSQGKALISYYYGNSSLRLARQAEKGWSIETVDAVSPSGSWLGYRSSLVLDQQEVPHIVYEDRGTLKHAYKDGKQWRVQVLAPAGGEPWRYSAMTIDPENTLYVAYRDPVDGSLKVAVGRMTPQAQVTADQEKQDPSPKAP